MSSSYGGSVLHSTMVNGYGSGEHENGVLDSIVSSTASSATTTTTTSYQGIINSMATLSNIGNSCYLNSVVYTLRFTPNFLHNLHHLVDDLHCLNQLQQQHQQNGMRRAKTASLGRNQSISGNSHQNQLTNMASGGGALLGSSSSSGARSMSNKDLVTMANGMSNGGGSVMMNGGGIAGQLANGGVGSTTALLLNGGESTQHQLKCHRQTATEKLHELYQSLARNENVHHLEPYQPVQFLNAIQDVSTTFEGNQQQDAHEFLMCILDSIRETCQTLAKSFAESSDYQRTLNGVAQMACNDASTMDPPSSLSTAQIIASNSSTTTNSSSSISSGITSTAPFKSIFNLKRKSKRKDAEKTTTTAQILPPAVPKQTRSATKLVPDIVIDPTTNATITTENATTVAALSPPSSSSSLEKDIGQVMTGDCSANGSGEAAAKVPKLESDFFSDDFEGVTVSTTKCLSCETETEQKETMIDIAIPISGHESLDALDNPQAFFQSSCITKEYFRGDNKYRCEKCSAYTEAIRSISFEVLPRLLVVQLKRFSGGMEKINSFIPTPFVLQCFCRKCCARPDDKKLHVYRLYSVITHVGATMSAGHYITYTSALDCYCDYLDCEKEANAAAVVLLEGSNGGGSGGGVSAVANGMDYDLIDGKATNLSNPGGGGHHEKMGSNLIEKIKKNRLFKNKLTSSSSSGLKAKFMLGSSEKAAGGVGGGGAGQQSEALMNSHNELIERHLQDSSQERSGKKIGGGGGVGGVPVAGYQPQVCRSLNCCTIKAKASFLLKQVASCGESAKLGNNNAAVGVSDWNLYCNNPRHQAKFGGGGSGSSGSECGDAGALEGANLTASMSSSSSSATSGSIKQQNYHQNGGIGVNGTGGGGMPGRIRNTSANVSDEPIWYMCDDDKIKSMPQHEFKELLGSNRKIAITPYLLFYARSDL